MAPTKPLARINDFVVKFANVNGSGSASANGLFAKAILRMGVPVAARNIFPSNIQGLPTWYEVRVVEAGWRGRRGGVDLMVAMNPRDVGRGRRRDRARRLPLLRLDQAAAAVEVPRGRHRRSAMPLMAICNADVHRPAPAAALQEHHLPRRARRRCSTSSPAEIETLFAEQYKGKEPLLESNRKAFRLGCDYAREHFAPIGLKIERRDNVGDRIFIDGNTAAALGAVYGGATVCAWYPITPSSSLAESFAKHCAAATASTRRRASIATRSCRPRTSSRRSAW